MDNIKEVQVNLAEGFALIESDREIVNSALTDTIDEAGYDVTKMKILIKEGTGTQFLLPFFAIYNLF